MESPEKIKEGLRCCTKKCDGDDKCPYDKYYNDCENALHRHALGYIEHLEALVKELLVKRIDLIDVLEDEDDENT